MTKTLSIDKAGRVVIPQVIRKLFGLHEGAVLKLEVKERAVVLTPAEQRPALVRKNGVWVHEGTTPSNAWLNAVAEERDARASAIWGHAE